MLAKLWSVIPRLFVWPPSRSIAQVLERISLLMLVGGMLFEIITGVLNIQYDYIFGFSFYTAHYYGAWVFIAGFVVAHRSQDPEDVDGAAVDVVAEVLRTSRGGHRPETVREEDGLVADDPSSRRSAAAAPSPWSAAAHCSWP